MHDFIAWIGSDSEKSQVQLNEEAQEYRWATLEEARTLPLTKETKLLVQWYEQNFS